MKVIVEWTFDAVELEEIADQINKQEATEEDVRGFIKNAVMDALENARVELEAAKNDPSSSVGS